MLKYSQKLTRLIADIKWDLVAVLMFVPLVSESINRHLGNAPLFRRLGNLEEPLIEMFFLAGIGVFISVRGAQRIRTMETLRAAEQRYRAVVEDQTESICRFRPDWTLTFVNDAYCRYFGKQRHDLIGQSFMSFIPQQQREEVIERLTALSREGPSLTLEYQVVARGELRWQQWTNRGTFDAVGNLTEVQAVGRDITERKLAEAERDRLIGELQEKNADLETMNYTISHDFRGPLITVRGLLRWIERDAAAGNVERLKANISVISRATARMEQLIDQLSQLVRTGHGGQDIVEVEISQVAKEAVELVSGRLAQSRAEVIIATDLPTVRANRSLLLQVLQNLIENSIKFMGDQPCPRIEIGARFESGDTVLYVRDNGVGIAPSSQEKVFGLFSRLNNRGIEGCGLGLALVKRAVEVQGGRIWVESEGLGRGSTFCLSLPGAVPAKGRTGSAGQMTSPPKSNYANSVQSERRGCS